MMQTKQHWARLRSGLSAKNDSVGSNILTALVTAVLVVPVTLLVANLTTKDPGPALLPVVNSHVETQPIAFLRDHQEGFTYFIPGGADILTDDPPLGLSCTNRREWAWKRSGADASRTWIYLTLEANRQHQVSFMNVRVKIVKKSRTPRGFQIPCSAGGADAEPDGLAINLDERGGPRVMRTELLDVTPEPIPPYVLDPGQQQAFDIEATTESDQLTEWYLELDVVSDGKAGTLKIDDHGSPFRTAGVRDVDQCASETDEGDFLMQPCG